MGRISALRCPQCGWEAVTDDTFACGSCDSVLEVRMDLGHLTRSDVRVIRNSKDATLWRWFDFFPVKNRSSVVSLGEGYTPLTRCRRLGEHLGMGRLYVKNDTLLPSGSLKDRSNTVGISRAVELGFDTVAVSSTGNAAASVAAYAAAAGLRSIVLVPAGTDRAKVTQAHACGATVVVVAAPSLDGMGAFYRAAVKEFGWYDCLSTNPYRNEGKEVLCLRVLRSTGRARAQLDHPPHRRRSGPGGHVEGLPGVERPRLGASIPQAGGGTERGRGPYRRGVGKQ